MANLPAPVLTPPDWLTTRDGSLSQGLNLNIVLVVLDGAPQYRLQVVPVKGTFGCAVVQTINGRRLDTEGKEYGSPLDAIKGGLEELRAKLGW